MLYPSSTDDFAFAEYGEANHDEVNNDIRLDFSIKTTPRQAHHCNAHPLLVAPNQQESAAQAKAVSALPPSLACR